MSVFLLPPCVFHLPKVCRIPPFSSHLPKVRGLITASRAPCVRVSPAAVHFPPSEGVQYSHVFVSPSEGAWRRHSFESALYQRFFCRRAFPTFRRCAGFPRFRLTIRRCAEASLLREPPCISVSPAAVRFSPSEGAWSRHSFESALCQRFFCRRAFPTFRRCAVFPHFRLTFRRCAVSGAADAAILKRPDVLCRKTSIAITRILVFLPLLNRK